MREDKSVHRFATEDDTLRDTLDNTHAGPHVRYLRPALVKDPLTAIELTVFLGIWILKGAYLKVRLEYYWSTSDTSDRVPIIADAMREDRFKLILAMLSFMSPGYVGIPDDKLRKLREVLDERPLPTNTIKPQ